MTPCYTRESYWDVVKDEAYKEVQKRVYELSIDLVLTPRWMVLHRLYLYLKVRHYAKSEMALSPTARYGPNY